MVAPAIIAALNYSPYIITAVNALYALGANLGEKYGDQIRSIYREISSAPNNYERMRIVRENKNTLLYAAGYAAWKGFEIGASIYKQIETSLSSPKPIKKDTGLVQAALMFFAFISLSYFSFAPKDTTGQLIIPISTNLIGMIFSIILLLTGAFLLIRKRPIK